MSRLPAGTVLPPPSCAACGHDLTGAVDSARCPECGRPLVEVLVRQPHGAVLRFGMRAKPTRRYESKTRVLGMPLVSIALGPDEKSAIGRARGYFAIGDIATGVFALGGVARGVVAFGGVSIGGVTFGGLSLGTFAAFGGFALAWLGGAVGGFAVGLLASGGGAIGAVAQGGLAIGWLARGATARGAHAWSRAGADADTQALFEQYAWLVGPPGAMPQIHYGLAWTIAIAIVVAVLALFPFLLARRSTNSVEEELSRTPGYRP